MELEHELKIWSIYVHLLQFQCPKICRRIQCRGLREVLWGVNRICCETWVFYTSIHVPFEQFWELKDMEVECTASIDIMYTSIYIYIYTYVYFRLSQYVYNLLYIYIHMYIYVHIYIIHTYCIDICSSTYTH